MIIHTYKVCNQILIRACTAHGKHASMSAGSGSRNDAEGSQQSKAPRQCAEFCGAAAGREGRSADRMGWTVG